MHDREGNFVEHYSPETNLNLRYLFHLFDSAFEAGFRVLWKLGVAFGALPNQNLFDISHDCYNGAFPAYFALSSEMQIRQKIADVHELSEVTIDEIIEAYLTLATDYGPKSYLYLPVKRNEEFGLRTPEHLEPLRRLADLGYVTNRNNRWLWTDKIAPHMIATWIWNEKDANLDSINASQLSEQVERIQRKWHEPTELEIPDYTDYSVSWRALMLMRYWNGDGWDEQSREESVFRFDEAIYIASEMSK